MTDLDPLRGKDFEMVYQMPSRVYDTVVRPDRGASPGRKVFAIVEDEELRLFDTLSAARRALSRTS